MASPGPRPDTHPQDPPAAAAAATSAATAAASPPAMAGAAATASPQKSSQQQGQPFEPLDKSVSQTVKLNPKMELSRTDLLKLLSYMEAELQSRDVVIATLKTERVKNLLQYGRVGLSDPFLALQRDSIGGSVVRGGGVNEAELRAIEETQLAQLEHLIAQQRKAHQRMRHVLREAEKRHSRVVAELEEERRKHEHDTAQGDDVTYALEKDRTRLKQDNNDRIVAVRDKLKVKFYTPFKKFNIRCDFACHWVYEEYVYILQMTKSREFRCNISCDFRHDSSST
ncbi:CTTNBP2 N-terminal-like protein [Penaeus indicus]|uniref:CTTNBP2 N-terminal-like protein n=1 Tax=Penaeus indicus TaxID=29960 RepID=UPI00300D51EA